MATTVQVGLSRDIVKFQNATIDIEAETYEQALEKAKLLTQEELEALVDPDFWEEQDIISVGDIVIEG